MNRIPQRKLFAIVRRKIPTEILTHLEPEEWQQEALLGYEIARTERPEEKHHIFGAIQAVQKLGRREHKAKRHILTTDEEAVIENGAHRLDGSFTTEQREEFYQLLSEEDDTTRQIITHLLAGRTQMDAALRVGVSQAATNRRVKRFLTRARERLGRS